MSIRLEASLGRVRYIADFIQLSITKHFRNYFVSTKMTYNM